MAVNAGGIFGFIGIFVVAFWVAAIVAPIMYGVEHGNETNWLLTTCEVTYWSCCRKSCGKSGCSYQPHWIVRWLTNPDAVNSTTSRTGSYYGKSDVWYSYYSDAQDAMNMLSVGDTFQCRWDSNFGDEYRYLVKPGDFFTWSYLVWTICMWAIGGACILAGLIYLLVNYRRKIRDALRFRTKIHIRHRNPVKPTAFQPPAPVISAPIIEPVVELKPVDVYEQPQPPKQEDVVVPLPPDPKEAESDSSQSGSKSGDVPVY